MTVLVIAEHDNAGLKGATLSLVAAAKKLSDTVDILVAGTGCGAAGEAAAKVAGVTKVLVTDDAKLAHFEAEALGHAVAAAVKAGGYTHVLFAAGSSGKAAMPRAAVELAAPAVSEVTDVVSADTFRRFIYAGGVLATVKVTGSPVLMTVRPTAFEPVASEGGSAAVESFAVTFEGIRQFDFVNLTQTKSDRPDLVSAKRIVAATDAIGIPRGDVYIDCLTLTVSAEQSAAAETLKAITMCKKELGVRTVLGVSNISFGLPCRGYMNTTFLTLAMQVGLDLAIMNPNTPEMMAAVRAYRVLTSQDEKCNDYVAAYANVQVQTSQVAKTDAAAPAGGAAGADALFEAVRRGLKNEARAAAGEALKTREPLQVVNETLIPALDVVGDAFEKGSIFLPQLLQSATATQAAFEVIKTAIAASGSQGESKGRIVIATVKGDVHDIGKNIVRVILENYGYDVLDLGRDVPPERVVEAVRQTGAPLVGLSALMTTTVPNMQATIEALHAANLPCKVMVGGAVLTKAYAEQIGADFYAKDAKASADYAKQIFG